MVGVKVKSKKPPRRSASLYPRVVPLSLHGALAEAGLSGDMADVPVEEAPLWFRRFWAADVAAVTLPWAVYLSPDAYPSIVAGADPRLIAHEAEHVAQWRRLGVFRFAAQYLADYGRGRLSGLPHDVAYRAIRLEREAEEKAWQAIKER